MRLSVIAFSKLKTPGLREAADYYQRLIRPWAEIKEIELKALTVPEKNAATRTRIQEKEGQILLDRIKNETSSRGIFYLLDETGKSKPTREWAEAIRSWEREGLPVSFCLGSSLGFSQEVKERSKGLLSFGPHTLSHELARVVLFEQLYRAYSVTHGHPYHNEGS